MLTLIEEYAGINPLQCITSVNIHNQANLNPIRYLLEHGTLLFIDSFLKLRHGRRMQIICRCEFNGHRHQHTAN